MFLRILCETDLGFLMNMRVVWILAIFKFLLNQYFS